MATRKSIYLAQPNDSALHERYAKDPAMCDNGQLNYSRAVNAALDEWQHNKPEIGDRPYAQLVAEMTGGNLPAWMQPLSDRCRFSLLHHGITDISQLKRLSAKEIAAIPNIGRNQLAELNTLLQGAK